VSATVTCPECRLTFALPEEQREPGALCPRCRAWVPTPGLPPFNPPGGPSWESQIAVGLLALCTLGMCCLSSLFLRGSRDLPPLLIHFSIGCLVFLGGPWLLLRAHESLALQLPRGWARSLTAALALLLLLSWLVLLWACSGGRVIVN
jgi:hypothetical protein